MKYGGYIIALGVFSTLMLVTFGIGLMVYNYNNAEAEAEPTPSRFDEGTPVSYTADYTVFDSTDSQTENGLAWRICTNWWTTATELYCLEKPMTDEERYEEKLIGECGSPFYAGCISEHRTQDKLDMIITLLENQK